MLSYDEVMRLHKDLRERKVLSVYVDAEATDPAKRRAWRVRLNQMIKDLEERIVGRSSEEQAEAAAALELIENELAEFDGYLPESGWVGYATSEQLWYGGSTPVPMPDLVAWEKGTRVAPYVRALKQSRPVIGVVADQRHARILRYQYGKLNEEEVLRSDIVLRDGEEAGTSKRAGGQSGMRGEPRTDTARRNEEVSAQRLLREVVDKVVDTAGDECLVVVGGSPEMAKSVFSSLPERVQSRTLELSGLPTDATDAQLQEAIESAASTLSERLQATIVHEVIETTRSGGRAALRRERIERALQAGAVETLLITRAFARAEPKEAELFIDRTFNQSGTVEEISDAAAEPLDQEGGIGARLRFPV